MKFKCIKLILSMMVVVALTLSMLAGCSTNTQPQVSSHSSAVQSSTQPSSLSSAPAQAQSPSTTVQQTVTPQTSTSTTVQGDDKDGDGIPDAIEKTYGTNPYTADTDGDGVNDKEDPKPLFAENPIQESSATALPVKIKDARVEDNATADHLEISITNTGSADLNDFDIYYTITDKVDNKKEAYYLTLNGLTLKAAETKTVHFDNNVNEAGHYVGNMNGLYGTSKNGLTFNIALHAAGFKPLEFTVEKAKGTAEVAD
jgi:archaellum component FlaF (FlaF/FlaG flagellin family)